MQSFRFHPVIARWFEQKFGSPTEPQQQGWPAIQSGEHTLIAAPTGSGKTLAAFFAALDQLFWDGLAGKLKDETRVVYVSPLKALSNDIHKNLEEPLQGIRAALLESESKDVDVRAAVRTGDTPAAMRQAIIRKPPHILVTTPESLYLLLTSESGRKLLKPVRTLIVDEIHAVVGNRRGSHLALTMERLQALIEEPLQRIGLSATQKPIEEVARFLVGVHNSPKATATIRRPGTKKDRGPAKTDDCTIIDAGYFRKMDLAIEVPGSPLEAVMSNEVWAEVYNRLAELIEAHRTTLVFVNTRRMAERVTHQLSQRLGVDKVMSHHGSLSARMRLDAENRLKRGELRVLVATASLELGIDIGSVELVCQLGPTRSIATLLQRVGRARHQRGGLPKGRIFPLSRDELVECAAMLRSVRRGELDCLIIPEKPLDVLAQQIVASVAAEDWEEEKLFQLMRSGYPYRNLQREEFDQVLRMLSEGFSTKRGRRGALIHHDAINHRVRGRRGARLTALTSGGAIPDNADYRVVLEPSETFVGTVNEDFAVESLAGDIFQLGNASWRILRVNSGMVRVEDAHGQPPSMPFWLGEAPGRTAELSCAVSALREDIQATIQANSENGSPEKGNENAVENETETIDSPQVSALTSWVAQETAITGPAARQIANYFTSAYGALGVIPSQNRLVIERFFDESGGMQLVIHSPFGIRLNRAWGLALRKRFCRSFNFELQAAATDDAIVLSLGTQHSFPLEDVFRFLHSNSVRDILIQALLDAPMFAIHWRWNASRSMALPRQRGGRKVPAPLQRMESENLLAAVFPDQLACLENIAGDRVVPEHPLVHQTIEDCLTEAMDIDGLIELLKKIESGSIQCIARDLPEPSPMASEILNAKPYAFLDNAPLEERRTQAVYTRRASESSSEPGMGVLDIAAIETVCNDAWPRAGTADELHEALLLTGALTDEEILRVAGGGQATAEDRQDSSGRISPELGSNVNMASHSRMFSPLGQTETLPWLEVLTQEKRAGRLTHGPAFWVAAERLPLLQAIYLGIGVEPGLEPPKAEAERKWERPDGIRELVRGRMEVTGPITVSELAAFFELSHSEIQTAMMALEAEGFVLRGLFRSGRALAHLPIEDRQKPQREGQKSEIEWCDRRLLARIHRLTLNRLRAEIQPVSLTDFQRFLLIWQRVAEGHQVEGPNGVESVLEFFDGYQLSAAAWEPEVLALRVKDYSPRFLDQLCFTGRIGWGRLTPPLNRNGRPVSPVRSSPISLFRRDNLFHWLALAPEASPTTFAPDTTIVLEALSRGGAMFFGELVRQTSLLPSRVENALAELSAQGWVTADSFEGLRALLLPQEKRTPFADKERKRRHKAVSSVEFAGRWSLLRNTATGAALVPADSQLREHAIEVFARVLLRRYGVVFRRLLEREPFTISWYELGRVYRRLEARGEIRGGYFVSGISGEQFALPEAIGSLRSLRKSAAKGELITVSGADPLNLVGIITPGPRVAAVANNRILFRDGIAVAALEAGKVIEFENLEREPEATISRALKIKQLPTALRPYYAHH